MMTASNFLRLLQASAIAREAAWEEERGGPQKSVMQCVRGEVESLIEIFERQMSGVDAVFPIQDFFDDGAGARTQLVAQRGMAEDFPTICLAYRFGGEAVPIPVINMVIIARVRSKCQPVLRGERLRRLREGHAEPQRGEEQEQEVRNSQPYPLRQSAEVTSFQKKNQLRHKPAFFKEKKNCEKTCHFVSRDSSTCDGTPVEPNRATTAPEGQCYLRSHSGPCELSKGALHLIWRFFGAMSRTMPL